MSYMNRFIKYAQSVSESWKSLSLSLSLSLSHRRHSRQGQTLTLARGFTIVELLIVIVIIGILATIVIVAYNGITTKANQAAATSNATQAAQKVAIYYASNGTIPATLAAADISNSDNSLQYVASTAGGSFCITATKSNQVASAGGIAGNVNPTIPGACPGATTPANSIVGSNNSNKLSNGKTCPANYIVVPGNSTYGTNDFCAMKYEAKNDGSNNAVSVAAGTPWVSITQTSAITTAATACTGCHLMTEPEWMTLAANVLSVPSNWSGGSVGSGYIYSGHNDNAPANALAASTDDTDGYNGTGNTAPSNQRRTLTLTNGQVIWDMAGNVWEWTNATITGNQPGASGWSWRQWNSLTNFGGLPQLSRPASIALPGQDTSTWSSTQGIGQLSSNSDDMAVRAFLRGGGWSVGAGAGVLYLALNGAPSDSGAGVGFRVVAPGS